MQRVCGAGNEGPGLLPGQVQNQNIKHQQQQSPVATLSTCCTMEKAPEMSAWLAMIAASVASTTMGQSTACGTDCQ